MSARILALLELADEAPEPEELADYLTDPEPEVRRTALTVLSESTEDWAQGSIPLATALLDDSAEVRDTAADLLAELRELLVAGAEFAAALRRAAASPDPRARVAAVANLWRHRLLSTADARTYLSDDDETVRTEAVHALVSLGSDVSPGADGPPGADEALGVAARDDSVLVRAAVARGLGSIGDPRGAAVLTALTGDPDPEVTVAALTALAATGCPPEAATRAASLLPGAGVDGHPNWRVREAAATALSAAAPETAAEYLLVAVDDTNLDVRKAAVRSLAQLAPAHPDVPAALRRAGEDPDADVRAYARQALTHYVTERQR
ncbi:MAG TPA: HEAT repeat domain-containing protein [Pseudonocardia sp.]|jgi:HEAT repeat protein|nr:HEAT repeat domain-containing protein [Pseudonocardia sp.]